MEQKQKLLILGAGPYAKFIKDMIVDLSGFEVTGFVIDMPPFEHGSSLDELPIFWVDELEDIDRSCRMVCGLGSMKKVNLIKKIHSYGFSFVNLVHPHSFMSKTANIGHGVIINSGAQIATKVAIGNHVLINRGALIGHDVVINDFVTISPGANIASNVNIGPWSNIGMGAIIIDHVNIGEASYIGAGSLVTKDIPDHVKVVGIPARIIEENYSRF